MPVSRFWVLAAAGVVLLVVISFALYSRAVPLESLEYRNAVNQISVCMRKGSASMSCARPIVREALDPGKIDTFMSALAQGLSPQECHQVGHLAGQRLFEETSDIEESLSRCSRECDSACPHGVISEAFAQELGFSDPSFELGHMRPDEIGVIGKRLCMSTQTCHGVGHVLFHYYRDFAPSIAACEKIAPDRLLGTCYSGLYMEYADILQAKSILPFAEVPYPDLQNLNKLCPSQANLQAVRTCFLYFTRMAIAVIGGRRTELSPFEHTRTLCVGLSGENRSACFAGLGASRAYLLKKNVDMVRKECEKQDDIADEAACYFGAIYVDPTDRLPQSFALCRSLSSETRRSVCFQGIFSRVHNFGESTTEVSAKYCQQDKLCENAERDHLLDPWRVIKNAFGPGVISGKQ